LSSRKFPERRPSMFASMMTFDTYLSVPTFT
jgi:hypothetical protein